MNKQVETIRAEIARINLYSQSETLAQILHFIDSLPEQPVTDCHNLEEGLNAEIENYFGNIPDDRDKIDIARHFAEWGAEHLKR